MIKKYIILGLVLFLWLGSALYLHSDEEKTPDNQKEKSQEETTQMFKIPTTAKKVVFVLDISGSMKFKASESEEDASKGIETGSDPKKDPRTIPPAIKKLIEENEKIVVQQRWDAVKKEAVRAILRLKPKVRFNIVLYSNDVKTWQKTLVYATNENKIDAIEYIKKINPDGGTNLFGGLQEGWKFLEGGKKPKKKKKDKDDGYFDPKDVEIDEAIYLISDGSPTIGVFVEGQGTAGFKKQEALEWVKKTFQEKPVWIHTIAVGDPDDPEAKAQHAYGGGVDLDLMEQIAKITGGTFRHVVKKK